MRVQLSPSTVQHKSGFLNAVIAVVLSFPLASFAQASAPAAAASAPIVAHDGDSSSAQAPTPAAPSIQLQRLNTEGAILEARLRNARMQAEIDRLSHTQVSVPLPVAGTSTTTESASSTDADHALSISAYEGRFEARVHVAGQDIAVRQGDHILNGWTVQHIDESGVTLVRGHQRVVLRV